MQTNWLATLLKILILEREKGCNDTAVVGGLDKFMDSRPESGSLDLEYNLPGGSYTGMSVARRKQWIDEVILSISQSRVAHPVSVLNFSKESEMTAEGYKRRVGVKRGYEDIQFDAPVTSLPRISKLMAEKLKRLGVRTVRDLIYLFPRYHNDFGNVCKISDLSIGTEQTVMVTVWEAREEQLGKRRKSTEAIVGDETGNIRVVWFNQPYLARTFQTGIRLVLSGRVGVFNGSKVLESPEYEIIEGQESLIHTGRLVPVYPLTDGLHHRSLRGLIKKTLDGLIAKIVDPYPKSLTDDVGLYPLDKAISQSHYPTDLHQKEEARRRLAFDELLMMQLYVMSRRKDWRQSGSAASMSPNWDMVNSMLERLAYSLTGAQKRCLEEILQDMGKERPMTRLLQGEVGSGKTVVALAALLSAIGNGYQGAFMAPTEILAQQHFNNISEILGGVTVPSSGGTCFKFSIDDRHRPVSVGLLIGSQTQRQKKGIQEMLINRDLDLIVGTHALAQQRVEIPNLGFAVVDEQHRFGVMQRASLREKGGTPHLLVMSATPIPRSLAPTLYGDLDISVLDELPPGRQIVTTSRVEPRYRGNTYAFVRRQIEQGRQVFVICPLIWESDVLQSRSAIQEFETLSSEIFPDLRLKLLHGRMASKEKEDVMESFYKREVDILVSTAVIEVGIDNPNATVILIEGAERFGLAQLHQLRGRVGRGEHSSYCFLMYDNPSVESKERLQVLENLNDGFAVAEADLKFRGPGDFFGVRQSGLPDLRMAKLSDQDLLSAARKQAAKLIGTDDGTNTVINMDLLTEIERYSSLMIGETS